MRYILFVSFLILRINVSAQVDTVYQVSDVNTKPEYKGDVYKFLTNNLRYPNLAKQNGTQGKIYAHFIINEDGRISDVTINKHIRYVYDRATGETTNKEVDSLGDGLEKEAIRVIKLMPAWEPAIKNDKPVKVFMTFPLVFKLS